MGWWVGTWDLQLVLVDDDGDADKADCDKEGRFDFKQEQTGKIYSALSIAMIHRQVET